MNVTKLKNFKEECTGCFACQQVCTLNAICMEPNEEGFYYPIINENKCTNCNKCIDVCMINNFEMKQNFEQKVYSCQVNDEALLIEATSGGFFPIISKIIIDLNGSVYGAAFDTEMNVVHTKITQMEDMYKLNGSKYVQSRIDKIYSDVKCDLDNNVPVLFSGTPCQVAGLNNYLGNKKYDSLYTVDVLCYGVPSQKVFSASLREFEKDFSSKVIDYRFRDKHSHGWSHTTVIKFKNNDGQITKYERENYYDIPYYRMFARRDCFRESCYSCPFVSQKRVSDLTIANFWNIEKITNNYYHEKGVSMVVINSVKGDYLFESSRNYIKCEEHSMVDALKSNEAFTIRAIRGVYRDKVYKCLNNKGFVKMIEKYYTDDLLHRILRKLNTAKMKCLRKIKIK